MTANRNFVRFAHKVLIWIFFIFWVSKKYIGIVVFCIRDYISRVQIHSILMEFFENFGLHWWVLEGRTMSAIQMNKLFIKTRKISQITYYGRNKLAATIKKTSKKSSETFRRKKLPTKLLHLLSQCCLLATKLLPLA